MQRRRPRQHVRRLESGKKTMINEGVKRNEKFSSFDLGFNPSGMTTDFEFFDNSSAIKFANALKSRGISNFINVSKGIVTVAKGPFNATTSAAITISKRLYNNGEILQPRVIE